MIMMLYDKTLNRKVVGGNLDGKEGPEDSTLEAANQAPPNGIIEARESDSLPNGLDDADVGIGLYV